MASQSDLDIRSAGYSASSNPDSETGAVKAKGAVSSMPVKNAALDRVKSPPASAPGNGNANSPAPAKPEAVKRAKPAYRGATAQEMSAKQRDISVAEFFQKNRHLLGFDNPRKALLTTVKEAVDNSLDACEEAGILPEITVSIDVAPNGDGTMPETPAKAERFIITVADNGPGIVKKNIGKVFAKLLYGSKFHRLRMSRGQQGIGISAAGMYGQLTTGKPTKVLSKIKNDDYVHSFEVSIDTKRNEPVEHEATQYKWDGATLTATSTERGSKPIKWPHEHGTTVSIELEGKYQKGKGSVDEYLELTAVANPHVHLKYFEPDNVAAPGEARVPREFARGVDFLPDPPREIKPHPYGIELGMLLKMLQDTQSHWLSGFLSADFTRVPPRVAEEICKTAGLSPRKRPRDVIGPEAEALYRALQKTKLMAPPTDCISPIGEQAILKGLHKEIKGIFYTAVTRAPAVYRGNPFAIEAGLAFGSEGFLSPAAGTDLENGNGEEAELPLESDDEPQQKKKIMTLAEMRKAAKLKEREAKEEERGPEMARLIRFANRVPLIYQQTACATYKAAVETTWKKYGLSQSRGTLPQGSMVIFVHMASVWVPFTSESKEAIADYDEIRKEIRLALQECGRRLNIFLRRRDRAKYELDRRSKFALYIIEVANACGKLKGNFSKDEIEKLKNKLQSVAEHVTGGEETEEILNRKVNAPEELPNTIIVAPQGAIEGGAANLIASDPALPQDLQIAPPAASTPEKASKPGPSATTKQSGKKKGSPEQSKAGKWLF